MMSLEAELLTIVYRGPANVAMWTEAAEVADGLAGNGALVLLVDLRQAFPAAGFKSIEDELGGHRPIRTALTRRSMPGVMLVPEKYSAAYKRFAGELAKTGIERAVFTSASQARACAWQMREAQRSARQQFSTLARRVQPTGQSHPHVSQPRTQRSSWHPTTR